MKFCPTCQTRFDEEILRFCTKDGTPLVEENQPSFTEMPSESTIIEEDFGEETVIRRKPQMPAAQTENIREAKPRIVIPTTEKKVAPQVPTKTTQVYRQPVPPKSNTTKTVFLTILGTIVLVAAAFGAFLFLRGDSAEKNENINVNTNLSPFNANLDTNLSVSNSLVDFNSNVDSNTNLNTNASLNTNITVKTPTPRPTTSPSATPTPTANANQNSNSVNSVTPPIPTPSNTRPISTPTPIDTVPTPKPLPTETVPPSNRPVNAGVLNGRAVNLTTPAYPPTARQAGASGRVTVQVLVDEGGNVLSARATGGHPMLRAPAEAAARQSRFNPVKVGDHSVQATGIVLYNFINQ